MGNRRSSSGVIGVALLAGFLLAGDAAAEEPSSGGWRWTWSASARGGAEFLSGDYGDESRTDILYLPFSAALELESFVLEVTVPWLRIRGAGAVLGGDVPIPTGSRRPIERKTRHGIGDVVLSASYLFYPESEQIRFLPVVQLTGKVKLPTADEDAGLGTGKTDYVAQIDVSKTLWRITPFGSFGRRFVGDPSGLDLDDTFFASGGFGLRLTRSLAAGLSYDWRQASSDDAGDTHELSPYATLDLGSHFSLESYAVVGLSRYSAEYGGGFRLTVRVGSSGDEPR